jgi:hypothetical protein
MRLPSSLTATTVFISSAKKPAGLLDDHQGLEKTSFLNPFLCYQIGRLRPPWLRRLALRLDLDIRLFLAVDPRLE